MCDIKVGDICVVSTESVALRIFYKKCYRVQLEWQDTRNKKLSHMAMRKRAQKESMADARRACGASVNLSLKVVGIDGEKAECVCTGHKAFTSHGMRHKENAGKDARYTFATWALRVLS